jgi:hypothetical protein
MRQNDQICPHCGRPIIQLDEENVSNFGATQAELIKIDQGRGGGLESWIKIDQDRRKADD